MMNKYLLDVFVKVSTLLSRKHLAPQIHNSEGAECVKRSHLRTPSHDATYLHTQIYSSVN